MNFFNNHFPTLLTLAAAVVYSTGFFVWNFYLSHFGFFEYDFVQMRYLSAGLFFWVAIGPFVYICIRSFLKKSFLLVVGVMFLLLTLRLLIFVWFPAWPQYLGGLRPIATTIIASPSQIKFIENFDIYPALNAQDKESVQTYPVCLIYQNDQYALFFSASNIVASDSGIDFRSRVLSLSKDQFVGFQITNDLYSLTQCGLSSTFYSGYGFIPVPRSD